MTAKPENHNTDAKLKDWEKPELTDLAFRFDDVESNPGAGVDGGSNVSIAS